MNTLTLKNAENISIDLTKEAAEAKSTALTLAGMVKIVKDDQTAIQCANARRGIKDILREVEASRKQVKAPLLKLGKDIDAKASEFVSDLQLEDSRLESMQTPYEIKKREELRKAEETRQAELRELQILRQKEEEKSFNAQLALQNNTVALKAVLSQSAQAIKSLEADAKMIETPIKQNTDGVRLRKEWQITIINAAEAYKIHPEFFKLVPDTMRIKDFFKANPSAAVIGISAEEVSKTY